MVSLCQQQKYAINPVVGECIVVGECLLRSYHINQVINHNKLTIVNLLMGHVPFNQCSLIYLRFDTNYNSRSYLSLHVSLDRGRWLQIKRESLSAMSYQREELNMFSDKFYNFYCMIIYLFGCFFSYNSGMTNPHDRPWSTQPHTQREMAQLKTRQEQVHVLISMCFSSKQKPVVSIKHYYGC